jgi:rubrerythrin
MPMPAIVDFGKIGLRGAFDFAIMIEEDAQNRYAELARLLGDEPGGAGDVFRMMVLTEGKHRSELVARRDALFRDDAPRIEISVLDEGPERPDVADDELPSTSREALEVALAAEERAHAFYRTVIPQVRDREVRAFFLALMEEESEHQALLARKIAGLPAGARVEGANRPRARAAARAALPSEEYPDRELLREVLPRFDAATQAVATAVIVDGTPQAELASALGVSRRTVARKLTRFLGMARQQLAGALAAATLAGCAGGLTHSDLARSGPPRDAGQALVERAPGDGGATEGDARGGPDDRDHGSLARRRDPADGEARSKALPTVAEEARAGGTARTAQHDGELAALAQRLHGQIARRMSRHEPALHERVAWAVAAEAKRASVDPLLVLALIHVESSFDPYAVSSAGAVGLMQLLEPTMRRERERSGLASADPRDPVANVQAGVRYLRRLLDAFDGELDTALMAYNAGPSRIRGHLRQGGIPERFHVYPKKVRGELERLRARWADVAASTARAPRSSG